MYRDCLAFASTLGLLTSYENGVIFEIEETLKEHEWHFFFNHRARKQTHTGAFNSKERSNRIDIIFTSQDS